MSDSGSVYQHFPPVWGDKADFIIAAKIEGDSEELTEQLWARKVGELKFEVCCIPALLRNLSLGDIVRTDEAYLFEEVVKPS